MTNEIDKLDIPKTTEKLVEKEKKNIVGWNTTPAQKRISRIIAFTIIGIFVVMLILTTIALMLI